MILEAALFRRDQRRESRPTRDAFCTALVDPTQNRSLLQKFSLLSLSLSRKRDNKKKKIVLVVVERPKI